MFYRLRPALGLAKDMDVLIKECRYPVDLDTDPRSSKHFWYQEANLQTIIFPEPIVDNRGRLLDIMANIAMGTRSMPIISKRVTKLLSQFRCRPHQLIPCTVWFRNISNNDYCYLNEYLFSHDLVDWSRSVVRWSYGYKQRHLNKVIALNSLEDYLSLLENVKPPVGIQVEHIELNEHVRDWDWFSLRRVSGGTGIFVSQRMKDAIESEGITGAAFYGLNDLKP